MHATKDKNKSGDLDQEEFQTLLKSHLKDIIPETLTRLFRTMDTDNNGRITFRELAVGLSIVGKGTPTEKLTFMFNVFDEDKNGRLTANEIQKYTTYSHSLDSTYCF
jgi:Ca2+-binding EF-hand superfamily protein